MHPFLIFWCTVYAVIEFTSNNQCTDRAYTKNKFLHVEIIQILRIFSVFNGQKNK